MQSVQTFRTFVMTIFIGAAALAAQADPALTGRSEGPQNPLLLWYPKPAGKWEEALPVGNGRLGAMIFGKPGRESLQLNEITVWSGKPEPDTDRPDAYKALPEIRKLLREEQYAKAADLTRERMTNQGGGFEGVYFSSYQTLGEMIFENALPAGEIKDYWRWLDIDRAVSGVEYKINGDTFGRETFASAPDGVIVTRLTSSRKGGLSFTLNLTRILSATTTAVGNDTLLMRGNTDYKDHKGNVDYEAQVRVFTTGGKVIADANRLHVSDADEAVVILAAQTSYKLDYEHGYRGADPHEAVTQTLAAACGKSFDAMEKAHVAEYRNFFQRVSFSLGDSAAGRHPTDQRLKDFQKGQPDPSLASLFFQFGRYLLISSSRPDNPLPSNSQGLWGDGLEMPWHCDYKCNINYQMNYWPVESANLGECHLPAIRLDQSLVKPGEKTARAYFNAPGWVLAMQTNAWGYTSPGSGLPWGTFYCGGAWICQDLWEHYAFGRDKEYLRSVYPTIKGACEACLAMLVPDADGKLITAPSTSPENSFKDDHGVVSQVDAGAAMEREIIYDLFGNYLLAQRVLGGDEAFRDEVASARAKIRPPQIGKAGQLMEWSKDWDLNAPEIHHRHTSHLFALFPGRQISPLTTPELAAAARKSLEIRGDEGTGWSKAWKLNFWARLRDGDHAYRLLCDQLNYVDTSDVNYASGGGTYANLLDAHPPFQIDGNFGAVSGMTEMLLQSHVLDETSTTEDRYILDLLPALPSAWPQGTIQGLRARGGFEVGLTWAGGKLMTATIKSVGGSACTIRYAGKTLALSLAPGSEAVLGADLARK